MARKLIKIEVYHIKGFTEMPWVLLNTERYRVTIVDHLSRLAPERGRLAELARKHEIDPALLSRLAKGSIEITPHYIHKIIRRGLMRVRDFVTPDEVRGMEKDEQSFWLKMIIEEDRDFSYFFNQAMLMGKKDEVLERIKEIVIGNI